MLTGRLGSVRIRSLSVGKGSEISMHSLTKQMRRQTAIWPNLDSTLTPVALWRRDVDPRPSVYQPDALGRAGASVGAESPGPVGSIGEALLHHSFLDLATCISAGTHRDALNDYVCGCLHVFPLSTKPRLRARPRCDRS